MSRYALALALPLALLAACQETDGSSGDGAPTTLDIVGEPAVAGEQPRGIYMVIPPEHQQAIDKDEIAHTGTLPAARYTIFMNRNGGTYTPGNNNASTNRSSVPQQTSVIPAWNVSDANWAQVMGCVRAQFAAYDVEITDQDPGELPHMESVVAGRPGDIQLPNGVGGVSPFTSNCSVIDRSIVYTFAEVFGNNYQVICEVVAQEVAHSFGLDHQFLCSDPMTYLTGCGAKSFQDTNAQCGEDSPRTCACGQTTQNSHQMLASRIGIGDALAPTVSILSPSDGATVPPGFSVTASAEDNIGIARVELYIDGVLAETKTAAPFTFVTSGAIGNGSHIIETRAYDSKNTTSESIAVFVEEGADPVPDPSNPDPTNPDPNNPNPSAPGDLVGGCSAASSSGNGLGALAVLMLGFALTRRRRPIVARR